MSFLERSLASYAKNEVITPYIEDAIIKSNWPPVYGVKVYNKERIFDGYFHPSSDVMAGELQLYYKFNPEFRDMLQIEGNTPTLELTFQIGSAFHAIGESLLIHLGFTTIEEVEVPFRNEEKMISGTTDIRTLTLPNGRKFLVDIKTANIIPKEVSEAYALQTMIYQDNVPGAPDEMALLFFGKAYPHPIRDFVVEKDQERLDRVYEKWDNVRTAVKIGSASKLKRCCNGPSTKEYNACPARSFCEAWNA
jgi:hypothetical protein